MRARWACPDLGEPKATAYLQAIPGSSYEFPDCPAAYLRGPHELEWLRDHGVSEPVADHLIDGREHPAMLVSEVAFEVEAGARNFRQCSAKVRSLVHLHISERNARDEYRREQERQKAKHK